MSEIKALLDSIRHNIEASDDKLTEFRPSEFEAHEEAWRALEERIGQPFPPDIEEFYRRCDGFVDQRYTQIYGIKGFISCVQEELENDEPFSLTIVGDGMGLDDKAIYFMFGELFKNGQPHFCYEDYVWKFDEDKCLEFRERVLSQWQEELEESLPLWHDGAGEVYDSRDDAERTNYGPVTMTELLAYILDTGEQY